jgi:MSHA biogenesis protein MshJ
LRVAGPYPSLIRYVKSLETALPQLRWGEMQLKANKTPPELTLTVYVLGVRQ